MTSDRVIQQMLRRKAERNRRRRSAGGIIHATFETNEKAIREKMDMSVCRPAEFLPRVASRHPNAAEPVVFRVVLRKLPASMQRQVCGRLAVLIGEWDGKRIPLATEIQEFDEA